MSKLINAFRKWWANFNMSSEELYLSKSSDHADLENRMRNITDPTFNSFNMGKSRYY